MNNDFDELNKSRIKVRLLKAFGFGGLIYVVINLCLNYFHLSLTFINAKHKGITAVEYFRLKWTYFITTDNFPLPMVIMISFFIGIMLALRSETHWRIKNENKTIKGKQRFMNTKEMEKVLYSFDCDKMKSAKKSGIIIAKENGKFYIDAETIHSLIIGTTRSGKGQTFVMPMIRHIAMSQAKHSMVINDPKGEIAENCTAMLRENGYKVVFLNLRDTNMSSLWNPLQKAIDEYKKARDNNEDLDKTIDEVQSLATVFTADEQSQPIWPESAKSLLVAMILYLLEKGYDDGNLANVSMYSIYNLFVEFGTENEVQVVNGAKQSVNALDSLFKSLPRGSAAKASYATSRFSEGDCRASIFTTLSSDISIFGSDSGISRLTSGNQINFEELADPEHPMAIIIIVPDEKKNRHVIASLFVNQCYNALVDYANRFTGQKLPQRVHFILDEFGNMVNIPDMDTKITVGAGRNLLFDLFVQDLNQLDTKYGNAAKTIRSNTGNLIYINSLDVDTNKYFSSALGDRTIEYTTYSGDLHSFLSHQSGSVDGVPLIRPEDLSVLPFGTAVTKRQRCYPIRTLFDPFYKLGIKAQSISEIAEGMDFIHRSLDETIYPLDSIWQRLFIPIKDNKGYMYKAVPRNNPAETQRLTQAYSRGSQTMVLPICFENRIYRKMPFSDKPEEREWTEIPCDNDHIAELGKINLDAYISSDGHYKTRWDNKRLELKRYAAQNAASSKASKTDYAKKESPAPSPLTEALQIINRQSELGAENCYNRFIEDKNKDAAEKLINRALAKRMITKEQHTLLQRNIEQYFNQ